MLAFKSTRYEALDTVLQCQIVLVGNAPVPSVHDLLYVINAANVKQLFFGSHTSHTLTLHIIYQFIYINIYLRYQNVPITASVGCES